MSDVTTRTFSFMNFSFWNADEDTTKRSTPEKTEASMRDGNSKNDNVSPVNNSSKASLDKSQTQMQQPRETKATGKLKRTSSDNFVLISNTQPSQTLLKNVANKQKVDSTIERTSPVHNTNPPQRKSPLNNNLTPPRNSNDTAHRTETNQSEKIKKFLHVSHSAVNLADLEKQKQPEN